MNEESNFKQNSSLGFEISRNAISTGTQECLSAQAGSIEIMLILREKKSPYPDRLQLTQDFMINSELFIPILCSKLQKNKKIFHCGGK